jgi:hypothetical protein
VTIGMDLKEIFGVSVAGILAFIMGLAIL